MKDIRRILLSLVLEFVAPHKRKMIVPDIASIIAIHEFLQHILFLILMLSWTPQEPLYTL